MGKPAQADSPYPPVEATIAYPAIPTDRNDNPTAMIGPSPLHLGLLKHDEALVLVGEPLVFEVGGQLGEREGALRVRQPHDTERERVLRLEQLPVVSEHLGTDPVERRGDELHPATLVFVEARVRHVGSSELPSRGVVLSLQALGAPQRRQHHDHGHQQRRLDPRREFHWMYLLR
jgi:hypothetical protein